MCGSINWLLKLFEANTLSTFFVLSKYLKYLLSKLLLRNVCLWYMIMKQVMELIKTKNNFKLKKCVRVFIKSASQNTTIHNYLYICPLVYLRIA